MAEFGEIKENVCTSSSPCVFWRETYPCLKYALKKVNGWSFSGKLATLSIQEYCTVLETHIRPAVQEAVSERRCTAKHPWARLGQAGFIDSILSKCCGLCLDCIVEGNDTAGSCVSHA